MASEKSHETRIAERLAYEFVGRDITVSGPGGQRHEVIIEVDVEVPSVTRRRHDRDRFDVLTGSDIVWAYGGFAISEMKKA